MRMVLDAGPQPVAVHCLSENVKAPVPVCVYVVAVAGRTFVTVTVLRRTFFTRLIVSR
jgi:hypothetical protein